jgi:hypothetical protein
MKRDLPPATVLLIARAGNVIAAVGAIKPCENNSLLR